MEVGVKKGYVCFSALLTGVYTTTTVALNAHLHLSLTPLTIRDVTNYEFTDLACIQSVDRCHDDDDNEVYKNGVRSCMNTRELKMFKAVKSTEVVLG